MSAAPVASVRRLLGGSAFVFACRLGGAGLTFVLQIALARWMGATELGVYVLAFSWCILLSTVSHLGLMQASLRFIGQSIAECRPGLARGFVARSAVAVACSSLIIAGLFAFAVQMLDSRLPGKSAEPFLLAAATIPLYALINLAGGISNAFTWFRLAFLPSNLVRPLLTLLAVAAVWWQAGKLSAGSVMFAQLVVFGLLAATLPAILLPRLQRATAGHKAEYDTALWMRTAPPLLVANLFSNYFPEITMIVLGMFVPSGDIAIFNAAFRVAMLIAFGVMAVDAITMPAAAQLHASGRRAELQRVIARASQLRFWASLLGVALFVVVGERVLALFGPEFRAGYDVLLVLAGAQLIRAGFGPGAELLSVSGHQNRCVLVFAGALPVLVALVALLVPPFGISGAAVAVCLTVFGWNLWLNLLVRRLLGVQPDVAAGLGVLARGRPAGAPDVLPTRSCEKPGDGS